jgi:signal transduction histidine kinase
VQANQMLTSAAEILEAISDGVVAVDPSGHVVFANAAGASLCGFTSRGEMAGVAMAEVAARLEISDENGGIVGAGHLPHVAALAGRATTQRLCLRPAGAAEGSAATAGAPRAGGARWLEVQATPVFAAGGEVQYALNVMRDVSGEQRALRRQRLLDDSGAILTLAVDHMPTPPMPTPPMPTPATGDSLAGLQRWAEHLVRSFAAYCSVDLRRRLGPPRRVATAHRDRALQPVAEEIAARRPLEVGAAAGAGAVFRGGEAEYHGDLRDGVPWDARHRELVERLGLDSMILAPIVVRGETLGVLTLATTAGEGPPFSEAFVEADLAFAATLAQRAALSLDNARVHAEAEDAVRSRDELLAIVSHDVRNPLGVVLTGSALLLRGTLPPDKGERARRQVEAIQRAGHRINALVRDLLDYASIEGGELSLTRRAHDVAGLLSETRDVLQPQAATKSQELTTAPPAETISVSCDRERIVQVLGNVVGNSLKFGPAGGHIQIAAVADGAVVQFTVTDDGPGMSPEELANLFDRSWQARRRSRDGVGLGLAIVKGIVEAHGGRVWAESTLGEGTRLHFTLPVESPA